MLVDRPRPACDATIGTRDSASIWSNVSSDEWLASMIMPSRFISATHCRPSGDRPRQRASPVAESANWLVRLCTGPAIRTPSRWKVVSSVRSSPSGQLFSIERKAIRLPCAVQPLGVGGGEREADLLAILADDAMDRDRAHQRGVARLGIARGGQRRPARCR